MTDIAAISSSTASDNSATLATAASANKDFKFYTAAPATDNDDTTVSFGDFLDMINPLQHIPVISAGYRSITGDTISPFARIAGDTLYAGILGVASAGIAAVGAIADEAFAANNEGTGMVGTVYAACFGDDQATAAPATQLAAADAAAPVYGVNGMTPIPTTAVTATAITLDTAALNTQAPILVNTPASAPQMTAQAGDVAGQALPLDRSKAAYGGVMDTTMTQSAQQNQSLAMALTGNEGIIKAQHALRNSRFMSASPIPGSVAATDVTSQPQNASQSMIMSRAQAAPVAAPAPDAEMQEAMKPTPQTQAAMQGMLKDLQSLKGIDQYRNAAQSTPMPGSSVNLSN